MIWTCLLNHIDCGRGGRRRGVVRAKCREGSTAPAVCTGMLNIQAGTAISSTSEP